MAQNRGGKTPAVRSGYTHCACRDCFDVTVSTDVTRPELCDACKDAGCLPATVRDLNGLTYDCQRPDAYEGDDE